MKLYPFLLFVLLSISLKAQVVISAEQEDFIENFIQSIDSEGEFDFAFLFEELSYLQDHPLDINKASYEDFKKLFILNDIQIADLLAHREKFGEFIALYELQSIPSFDLNAINKIRPFITLRKRSAGTTSVSNMIKKANHTILSKWRRVLETRKGYTDEATENSRYLGTPDRLYNRYQMRYGNNLKFGLSMEKDEGEPIFVAEQKGFDFYSAHFHLSDISNTVQDLVLGDFSVSLGQGLILHNGFGSGKSTYVMDVKKGGRTLKSYTSLNETNFYRGLGISIKLNENFDLTAFASRKDIDANEADEPNDDGFDFFTSILNDGLHRSINERNKINSVNETTYGGRLGFRKGNLSINYNGLHNTFDKLFERRNTFANQFRFSGDKLVNHSIDYTYKYRNFNFFGESAVSDNGGTAHLAGVLIGLDKLADLSILYRNYDKDYQSLFSNSFGETSGTNNEKGLYIGFKLKPINNVTLSAYADQWSHPWVRFRSDGPSKGREYLAKLAYDIRRKANFYIQYKIEQKQQNSSDSELKVDQLVPIQLEKLRVQMSFNLSENIDIKSRVEFSKYKEEAQNDFGYLVYQDFAFKPKQSKYSISTRIAYFDTPGFDTRIYTYERDLQYEYFVPFFADQGWRYYVNLKWQLNRMTRLELRASQTRYLDRNSIGSSNNEIDGNTQTQLKAQVRIRI